MVPWHGITIPFLSHDFIMAQKLSIHCRFTVPSKRWLGMLNYFFAMYVIHTAWQSSISIVKLGIQDYFCAGFTVLIALQSSTWWHFLWRFLRRPGVPIVFVSFRSAGVKSDKTCFRSSKWLAEIATFDLCVAKVESTRWQNSNLCRTCFRMV